MAERSYGMVQKYITRGPEGICSQGAPKEVSGAP
jgi:hypothetical protein